MRTILFTSLLLLTFYFFTPYFYPYVSNKTNYFRAIEDKRVQQESVPSPRLLLIGGSNIPFGVDSKVLSDSLRLPVYNLGVSFALGFPNMLLQAVNVARKGDVVVFCFENKSLHVPIKASSLISLESPKSINAEFFSPLETVRFFHWKASLTVDAFFKHTIFSETADINNSPIYRSTNFNQYGDLIAHKGLKGQNIDLTPSIYYYNFSTFYPLVQSSLSTLKERGVRCFYLPSCIPKTIYNRDSIEINKSFNAIQKSGLQPACTPKSMVFEDTAFFDFADHLTWQNRPDRTRRISSVLKNHVNSSLHKQ